VSSPKKSWEDKITVSNGIKKTVTFRDGVPVWMEYTRPSKCAINSMSRDGLMVYVQEIAKLEQERTAYLRKFYNVGLTTPIDYP
jgi:hypothetical protein